jgi:hypothetical protein
VLFLNNLCEGDLEELIRGAHSCEINFVYALSPGLDMVLSSEEEIFLLKAKMNQVGFNISWMLFETVCFNF